MSRRQHPLDWVAPLLVGTAAAVAAEVAIAMLIYAGDGFLRSLTTVLTVEGVALGLGLWSAPAPHAGLIDRLRRWWMLCLAAFTAATAFGVSWSVAPSLGTGAVGQALGLTLLGALPLFTCGAVLGGLSSVARREPANTMREPGAAAALGGGLGFALTGLLLPRAPIPASLLVGCMVMLSGGGLIYGIVLTSRGEADDADPVAAGDAPLDDVTTAPGEPRAT